MCANVAGGGRSLRLITMNCDHITVNCNTQSITPPPPRPAPDTDYQIFVGRGPSTQEPGARGVRGSDRRHSFLLAMQKNARLIFRVLGMLKVYFFVFDDYSFAKSTLYITRHSRTCREDDYTFTSRRTVSQTEC